VRHLEIGKIRIFADSSFRRNDDIINYFFFGVGSSAGFCFPLFLGPHFPSPHLASLAFSSDLFAPLVLVSETLLESNSALTSEAEPKEEYVFQGAVFAPSADTLMIVPANNEPLKINFLFDFILG